MNKTVPGQGGNPGTVAMGPVAHRYQAAQRRHTGANNSRLPPDWLVNASAYFLSG